MSGIPCMLLLQFLNLASVATFGLVIVWKGLGLFLNTKSPIVVVRSGSMEPAFYRGDLLFLTNPASEHYHTGDIAMYRIPGADIPIVHRVIEARDLLLTKGLDWLGRRHIVGKVRGFLPYIGYETIAMRLKTRKPCAARLGHGRVGG
ncbi:hypothetical protein K503DRAFT_794744 [Rhizopogon vinicolor AM-OR11-026]|uniref:Signal peptidase complex catalytic subunit SEC11 n=1 Tax=Rhizopogon vinicolor AM-OR11-026 TaxID=1314800 RepID=A0A1B7MIR7_9AGAM|nr:hypothetical protein K503DRAFT_794744 [Rhizopogon vinicolor AM-OR11-026]